MRGLRLVLAATICAALAGLPAASFAGDLCLQYSGGECDITGLAGFFRFMGAKLPSSPNKAVHLHGRACGIGTVTGTAVPIGNGALVNIFATFECEGTPGLIKAVIDPDETDIGSNHEGSANLGNFNLNTACTVTIVDCANEPTAK